METIDKRPRKSKFIKILRDIIFALAFIMYLNKDHLEVTYYKYMSSNGSLDASYNLALIYLNDKTSTQNNKGFILLHEAA